MSTAIYKAAAPGHATARKRNRSQRGCPAMQRLSCVERFGKGKEESANNQLSLFDADGEPTAAQDEMSVFFDTVRPHLQGLAPSDRMSVLSCLYWLKAGEDRETLAGLLRKPQRAVFEGIIDKVKI